MADNFAIGLLGSMDHLWFHRVILFSEPSSLLFPKTLKPQLAASKSLLYSSSPNSCQTTSVSEEENTPSLEVKISASVQDDQYAKQESEKETTMTETERERPTRLNIMPGKTRSHSSSPSTQKRGSAVKLQKTMSCKSLCELELEEVKGFMDLGFRFNKEQLSKRMMSVIPGLQRLELFKTEESNILYTEEVAIDDETVDQQEEEDDKEEKGRIIRPYLSEAWLIKRPDSPLLNLRIPRVSTAADMKKHLKYWARTVASAIQQES